MERDNVFIYATVLAILALWFIRSHHKGPNLDHIPTHGHAGYLTRFVTYYRWALHADALLQEGFEKFGFEMFKIKTLEGWKVICAAPWFIDDIRKAQENEMSIHAAMDAKCCSKYTYGIHLNEDGSRNLDAVAVVRDHATKNLTVRLPEVYDEIQQAFTDNIPQTEEWVSVPAAKMVINVVARASNRYFVGLPLCRDVGWVNLNIQFTVDVIKAAQFINLFPEFLKPFAAKFTNCHTDKKRAERYICPIVEDRLQKEQTEKGWEVPNDAISWLMEIAPEHLRTPKVITSRILTLNLGAIHTSSMTFTHALYHLASKQEYIEPLREEVQSMIDSEGWTKAAIDRMFKLDSFFKECTRVDSLGDLSMPRIIQHDHTFPNGVTLRKGTCITVLQAPIHNQEAVYSNSRDFNGFRFSKLREEVDGDVTGLQSTSTTKDWLFFGYGRHACPGRFFAMNELKAMMSYMLLTYDLKLAEEGVRPKNLHIMGNNIPNPKAHVMFRKRQI